ncbi:DUF6236 family protein [Kineococcus sp. SYSU DK005]|uniref:DUF6236 family protein n=1 Tax=Kineococcus sp. SYSU DK005 TaxID=3383126 RepID=UPI003D7E7A41
MLYYPLIAPPKPVLWQAILYWDSLKSIVPQRYELPEELQKLGNFYQPLSLDRVLSPQHLNRMVVEMDAVIANTDPSKLLPVPGPLRPHNRLYYGKLPESIETSLERRGALSGGGAAYLAREELLLPLLAVAARYAASASGQRSGERHITHTSLPDAHALAYSPLPGNEQPCLIAEIGSLLPVPSEDVPVEDVLEFRNRHQAERRQLIDKLDAVVTRHRQSRVLGHPLDERKFLHELEEAVENYGTARKKTGWHWGAIGAAAVVGTAVDMVSQVPAWSGLLLSPLLDLGVEFVAGKTRGTSEPAYTYLYQLNRRFSVPG